MDEEGTVLQAMGYMPEHEGFRVCLRCFDLYEIGPPEQAQLCRCRRVDQPTWPQFDYNERATLCRGCLQQVLPSGSRWSVWFCDECKARIAEFNQTHADFIPLGRHSLMHGIGLNGRQAQDPGVVEQLLTSFRGLAGRGDRLDRWRRSRLRANLRSLGLAVLPEITLRDYLLAMHRARASQVELGKAASFQELARRWSEG
jgi:hypothetical protein